MAQEDVTSYKPADATPTSHTTVIREGSGGGGGIFMAVVLLVAVVGGIYLFSQTSASETAKDNAIAQAASDVGDAATKVGDAAAGAAENVDTK